METRAYWWLAIVISAFSTVSRIEAGEIPYPPCPTGPPTEPPTGPTTIGQPTDPPPPPEVPKCLFGTYYQHINQPGSCTQDSDCVYGYYCEIPPTESSGHCCRESNPCPIGMPYDEDGQAIHCMGEPSHICPNGYMCTGSITSFSACCPVEGTPDPECQINECLVTYCSPFPKAQCIMSTDGECTARWYMDSHKCRLDVTDQCGEDSEMKCPPGVTPSLCLPRPCSSSPCTNTKWKECYNYNCGGCFARYFKNLREVTSMC